MLPRKEAEIRAGLVLAALVATSTLGAPDRVTAEPISIRVHDEGEFASAVAALEKSGGTIVLLQHDYRPGLTVSARPARTLRITGRPGVRVERLRLDRARNVSIGHLTVTPLGGDAALDVNASDHVDLHHLVITAAGTRFSASVSIVDANHVTVRHSTFMHCGDRSPSWSNCLQLERSANVAVEDSWFHDCYGCDFIHGRIRSVLAIRGNRFERALPCASGGRRCGHQDLIELFAGNELVFERNAFGVYKDGGAQLYLTGDMDHVSVVNNVFFATDPRVPGYRTRVGLVVGSSGRLNWCRSATSRPACIPRDVKIINNTILSGARRSDGYAGSIRMSSRYGGLRRGNRPLLANNVIGLLEDPRHVCSETRMSITNVVVRGHRCSRSDRVGSARVDGHGRPTAASTLLIGRATRRFAPRLDFSGRRRGAAPDIGAFEYRR